MIYRNITEVLDALSTADLDDEATIKKLRQLVSVYSTAHRNAPAPLVGVGCITYAEQQMVRAQQVSGWAVDYYTQLKDYRVLDIEFDEENFPVLIFINDNGRSLRVTVSSDEEGNDAGFLFIEDGQ